MKGIVGQVICEHRVTLHYWHDVLSDTWQGKIIHTELRQGRQYGGEVVKEIVSEPGTKYDDFKKLATDQAKAQMALFWTNEQFRKAIK